VSLYRPPSVPGGFFFAFLGTDFRGHPLSASQFSISFLVVSHPGQSAEFFPVRSGGFMARVAYETASMPRRRNRATCPLRPSPLAGCK
jgi:hypothetical protein